MFNNIALDVVIGLVFIYLLYGLLITILGEWVATKLGIRARLLRIAIERMLNDGYYVKVERIKKRRNHGFLYGRWLAVLGWARKVLLYEPDEFKASFAGRFYDYPAIKYLGRIEEAHKSRFSLTKPAYLSPDYFAETLIDFLKDKGSGSGAMERVAFTLTFNTHHIQPKSLKQFRNLFDKAGLDRLAFRQYLMQWFNETMDRATGWHKRKMQLISFWLGLVIAVSFNLDTITIGTQLSTDKNARQALVELSIRANDTSTAIGKALKNGLDTTVKTQALLSKSLNDVNKAIDEAHQVLGLSWDSVKAEVFVVTVRARSMRIYYYKQFNPLRREFWGLIITAVALSLGAPFWFDLLKKLVSIRGVGVKPEEKKLSKHAEIKEILPLGDPLPAPVPHTRNPVEDAVEAALQKYYDRIKRIPGVKSVFTLTKAGIRSLQVNVDNPTTAAEVNRLFPRFLVGGVDVPHQVVVSGVPKSQQGSRGIIANKSGKNGFGSLGCMLTRKETGSKHLLSCWHVLKGDLNYSGSDNEHVIVDHENDEVLAERWAGGIRAQYDYGLALCNPVTSSENNSFLKSKLGLQPDAKLHVRIVTREDVEAQMPVMYYDRLNDTMKKGLIYTESPEVDINYIDTTRTIKDVLVLTDDNEQTISREGNSGSIVFDENRRPIAMIIGGDRNYTYAIKLSHIFSIHTEMSIA